MEAYPQIAFPIRSHPARNVNPGGRELVNLSSSRVQPAYFVRFPLDKPTPSIPRDVHPVSARVIRRNVIRDELLGLDIQSHDSGAGGRPDHLPIRVGPHEVSANRALE